MSFSVNSSMIGGNLTRDVDFKYTNSGTALCTFSVAVNEGGRDNPKTTFVEVKAWERMAETCNQYLSKGSLVLIEGKLELEQWEDRSGNRRSKLVVVARRVQFLNNRHEDSGYGGGGNYENENYAQQPRGVPAGYAPPPMPDPEMPPCDGIDEDIPF